MEVNSIPVNILDPNIYTVQVFYIENGDIVRHRNWGWFRTFEEAEKIILENITDIYECGYYNYAIVNEVPSGICIGHGIKSTWYKAEYSDKDLDESGYIRMSANPTVTPCKSPIDAHYIIGLDI